MQGAIENKVVVCYRGGIPKKALPHEILPHVKCNGKLL